MPLAVLSLVPTMKIFPLIIPWNGPVLSLDRKSLAASSQGSALSHTWLGRRGRVLQEPTLDLIVSHFRNDQLFPNSGFPCVCMRETRLKKKTELGKWREIKLQSSMRAGSSPMLRTPCVCVNVTCFCPAWQSRFLGQMALSATVYYPSLVLIFYFPIITCRPFLNFLKQKYKLYMPDIIRGKYYVILL